MNYEEVQKAIRTEVPVTYKGKEYAKIIGFRVFQSNSGEELLSVDIFDARDDSVMTAVARMVEPAEDMV